MQNYSKPYSHRMLTGEGATCVNMSHVLGAALRRLGVMLA